MAYWLTIRGRLLCAFVPAVKGGKETRGQIAREKGEEEEGMERGGNHPSKGWIWREEVGGGGVDRRNEEREGERLRQKGR